MKHEHRILRSLALVVALPVAFAACGTGEADTVSALETVYAEYGDLRIRAEATGSVEPVRVVEVKSKASGEVMRLHVDVGDVVEPGALLAEVDPRDVQNHYDQVMADLQVTRARTDIAREQLRRSERLYEAGIITEQEMESARLDAATAEANLIKAETNADLAELQRSDVTIRAPMAGTIIQKSIEQGQVIQSASQNVSGGTVLFIMAALEDMQVRTLVDETDMGEIKPGMPVNVSVEAYPGRVFEGQVAMIEPQAVVEQNVTMFPVIVELANHDDLLRPGMNGEVEILIDEARDILLVPNSAIIMPQDAGAASLALGLDVESMDLRQFTRPEALGVQGMVRGDGAAGNGDGERAEADNDNGMRGRAARAAMARGGRPGGDRAGASASGERQPRRAVVFVVDSAGSYEPRSIQIGLNDWDRTQIVSGLEAGEELVVIGGAQLQAAQAESLDRMRERRGGATPFGR